MSIVQIVKPFYIKMVRSSPSVQLLVITDEDKSLIGDMIKCQEEGKGRIRNLIAGSYTSKSDRQNSDKG